MAAPLPVAFLDGRFLPLAEARISPLDRGFLFADAVYEVLPVYGGRPFRCAEHIARLERSLGEIGMRPPHEPAGWVELFEELVARNGGGDMYIYLQVTRGADSLRNHAIPPALAPTVFMMAAPLPALESDLLTRGATAITLPDARWKRCDIKSTALLPNVLAKTAAAAAGAMEAILVADGRVREGASSSILVVAGGALRAPPESHAILPGTTRDLVFELAARAGIEVRIGPVSEAGLRDADEILIGFATRGILPITRLDGRPVGGGRPGPVWRRLYELFLAYRDEVAGTPPLPAG